MAEKQPLLGEVCFEWKVLPIHQELETRAALLLHPDELLAKLEHIREQLILRQFGTLTEYIDMVTSTLHTWIQSRGADAELTAALKALLDYFEATTRTLQASRKILKSKFTNYEVCVKHAFYMLRAQIKLMVPSRHRMAWTMI